MGTLSAWGEALMLHHATAGEVMALHAECIRHRHRLILDKAIHVIL